MLASITQAGTAYFWLWIYSATCRIYVNRVQSIASPTVHEDCSPSHDRC
jgi:hypothetical protein